MKIFPVQKQFRFKAIALIVALAGCGLVFSGCGKKTPTAQTPAAVNETPAPAAAETPAPPMAADTVSTDHPEAVVLSRQPLTTANGSPDLGEINRTMIRWIVRNRRAPSSFGEFAATAGVTIPPPPAGQKYIIGGDKHVLLVPQ